MTAYVPFGRRLTQLAESHGDRIAIVHHTGDRRVTEVSFGELESRANRAARHLQASCGVGTRSLVAVGLGDEPLAVACWFGAWKLGACVLPLNAGAPAREREALLATAAELQTPVTVGRWRDGRPPDLPADAFDEPADDDAPLPDAVAEPGIAIGSGGTSGTPKITVNAGPALVPVGADGKTEVTGLLAVIGVRPGQVHLVCTPTYHTNGFSSLLWSVLLGDTTVLFERFDAARVLDAIERHRVNQLLVVPAVLQRLAEVDGIGRRDLSSLESVTYGGAPCPEWVARRWIELVGAERVFHGYGATEFVGKVVLRGDEWLERPGSCGRPIDTDVRIVDDAGKDQPPGEVGEIFMRPAGVDQPAFLYVGAEYKAVTPDGFVSLGDFGKLDAEGFLYVVDRRSDLIITGGANVYPAEVESVLSEHPDVVDVAVIGLPDDRWGRRVHAIVQPQVAGATDDRRLDAWCRARLAAYKCPKTYEFLERSLRTPVGKISRSRLLEERVAPAVDETPGRVP